MAEKYDRARHATEDSKTRRMRTAVLIPKATNTQLEYVILFPFPRQ